VVGDKVFDMPTQQVQTVLEVNVYPQLEGIWQDYFDEDSDGEPAFLVTYVVTSPPNPTGDSAFSGGGRCYFEVCDADETIPLSY
jgi:hypothetical protein